MLFESNKFFLLETITIKNFKFIYLVLLLNSSEIK